MSEVKEIKKDEKPKDIIQSNVAILQANLDEKSKLVEELTKELDNLKVEHQQAKDFMENSAKRELMNYIKPKTSLSEQILAKMSVGDLEGMKATLDVAMVPAFKSGTPVVSKDDDPKAALDNMFGKFAKSTWRKNK